MRKDLLTQESFYPKRINQKFANSANRIKYYNDKANRLRHSLAYINKPLHNNIKILNELMNDCMELRVHKEFLKGKGFSFNVHTHYTKIDTKRQYSIFKYTIVFDAPEHIIIIKND